MATLTAAGSTVTDKADIIAMEDGRDGTTDHAEKASQIRVVDTFHVLGLSDEDADFYNNYTPEQRKRTRRKVS